jgi:glycine/D-amino acid oxidase-like deaminating enzyme
MKVIVIGNGILALSSAREIHKRNPDCEITIIGPQDRKGCASLAAAAMFNSFAEVDQNTLSNGAEARKFELNRRAAELWRGYLEQLREESGCRVDADFGTFVVNNHVSDSLEDRTFDAIVEALVTFEEPHELVSPHEIENYSPNSWARASRGVYIPNEGFANPDHLIGALDAILRRNPRVEFIDAKVVSMRSDGTSVTGAVDSNEVVYTGDSYFLAPGATFSQIIELSCLPVSFPKIFFGVGCGVLLKTGELTLKNCIRTPNRGLACGVYCVPRNGDYSFVGASNLISPVGADSARATSVLSLIEAAIDQINRDFYRAEFVAVKVGWRPTSEDTMPLLGKVLGNLVVATGTKRDGLHCSPLISKGVAKLIGGDASVSEFEGFEPDRKPMRTLTREEAVEGAVSHKVNAAFQHGFRPSRDRMLESFTRQIRDDINSLHDRVGAHDWGIPPEMIEMYRYGHLGNREA